MSEPLVLTRTEGTSLHVQLNDPARRNPLSDPMIAALNTVLTSSEALKASVVVIRGSGGFFSAGGDIAGFQAALTTDATEQYEATHEFRKLFLALDELEGTVVAVVEGQALGGGCGLAAACDIVLATASARFGCPEVNLGAYPMVITPALVRAMGARAAIALSSRGTRISATRAQQLGLVTEVYPDAEFDAEVDEYVAALASVPGHVLRMGKLSVRASESSEYRRALESGSLLRSLLFSSPAFHDGVNAFVAGSRRTQ